jgi:GUN4-like
LNQLSIAWETSIVPNLLGMRFLPLGLIALGLAAPAVAIPFRPNSAPKIAPLKAGSKSAAKPAAKSTAKPEAKPEAKPAAPMTEPVVTSKQDLDYERLQELMKAGEWADANLLTSRILLTIGKGYDQGYVTTDQIAKMSCTELKTVDDLWRYYTGGRSGLSTQANVWRKIQDGSPKAMQKFEARVGWQKGVLNPDPKAAQIGHMPLRPSGNGGSPDAEGGGWIQAMPERLATCGMIPKIPKPVTIVPMKAKPVVKAPAAK